MIPVAVEQRIGQAVDKQARTIFSGQACENAEGQAAFASLIDKLKRAGGVEAALEAHVLSSTVPNAYALPGGKIYLLDGLLQKARDPDEIAGVLAHEMGHVVHRDHLRTIIQTGGTSFLIGLLFGDVTGGSAVVFVGRALFNASYSREAERAADVRHRCDAQARSFSEADGRISVPRDRRTDQQDHFDSHPRTEDRLALMSKEARPDTGAEILSPREWQALKNICKAR